MLVRTVRTFSVAAATFIAAVGAAGAETASDPVINSLLLQLSGGGQSAAYAPPPPQPVVVQIPFDQPQNAPVKDPVVDLGAPAPDPSKPLDMSDSDGSLRACYANGGIAIQRADLQNYCSYESPRPAASTNSLGFGDLPPGAGDNVLPMGAHSDYAGAASVDDSAILECVERGGKPVQLTNMNWACAM